jgi:hypothetical protein
MLKQRRSATPIQPKRIALRSKQSFDKSGGSTPSDFNQVSLIGSGKISQISQCSVWSFAAGTFDQCRGWNIFRTPTESELHRQAEICG